MSKFKIQNQVSLQYSICNLKCYLILISLGLNCSIFHSVNKIISLICHSYTYLKYKPTRVALQNFLLCEYRDVIHDFLSIFNILRICPITQFCILKKVCSAKYYNKIVSNLTNRIITTSTYT